MHRWRELGSEEGGGCVEKVASKRCLEREEVIARCERCENRIRSIVFNTNTQDTG